MSKSDYWKECILEAAEECGLEITSEQLESLACFVQSGHEHYGMAFYSPPASDRLADIEREWNAKLKAKEQELDRYRENAETAVKRALRQHSNSNVSIGENGEVIRWDGRMTQIQ